MDIEEGKQRGVTSGDPHQPGVVNYPQQQPQQGTGTFQGVAAADHPQKPVTGFPQPGPPPDAAYSSAPPPPPQYYGNQAGPGPGYPVSEGPPAARELPCCGLGCGWVLFILGFILGVIPWYIGAIMLFCYKREHYKRERAGYIACAVFAVIGTVAIIVSVTTNVHLHHYV